jgi:hypothetical protein
MLAAGIKTPVPLDELESHLREDFRALVSAGKPEAEAFQLAVSRLGKPGPLQSEFNKLKKPAWWPVTLSSWLFATAVIWYGAVLARHVNADSVGVLLLRYAQILSLTPGYCAAFLAGIFGIVYVCYRKFGALLPNRQQSLAHGVLLFSQLAAGLTIATMVLGMFTHSHQGPIEEGDMRELGTFNVVLWYVVLSVMQRCGGIGERATMLLCIGGNVVVSLAWFGPTLMRDAGMRFRGITPYVPLGLSLFTVLHLLFLAIGMLPAPEEARS